MLSISVASIGPVVTTNIATQGSGSLVRVSGLPEGFPKSLNSPLAWVGADVKEGEYIYRLTEADIAELERAHDYFMGLGLDGDRVTQSNFPLPTLGPKLRDMSNNVYNGKGFCLIRGLDLKNYEVEKATILFFGIQSYIASQRGRQDRNGNILVHITADKSSKLSSKHHRHSTDAITFHNEEACDVVGWMTRSTAESGGKCIISSAYQVYNEIAASQPDMIRTLVKSDWPFALPRFKCRPIMFYKNGKLITNFGRAPLLGNAAHPRPEHLPSVNKTQAAALNAIEAIADKNKLVFKTEAGDMHFINNLAVFHRREAFLDGSGKRHLVRTWVRDAKNGWEIPESLRPEYFDTFERQDVPTVCHVEPMPEGWFPLRTHPN